MLWAPGYAQTAEPEGGVYGDAILRDWVQPEYPAAARAAKQEGTVVVEFAVEVDGHVSRARVKKTTDEQFNAPALGAVARWVFLPALADGKPVESGMQVPVLFTLAQLNQKQAPVALPDSLRPTSLRTAPPQLSFAPDPNYPAELEERMLPGRVALEFIVEADGTARDPKVLWTPHAAFVSEALRTLGKYRFEPAHQGPLPVKSGATQGEMEFKFLGVNRADLLAANHITVTATEKLQTPPRPVVMPEPVYPRERLLAGESGSATVEFTVAERGGTIEVRLRETSQPEFGAALVAAVEAWGFDAALADNQQPAAAKLVVVYEFAPPVTGAVNRLVAAMQPGGAGVGGAAGLDQRLQPIWRTAPVYPQSLRGVKPAGKAVVEFVIDREGRARLPRVKSATQPEFGWAAATAVSQWVFAGPVRGGQPTDVKVSIPFEFAPPEG